MTKLAYLECPTGIAGDMCLGALVDAGVPLEYLQEQLKGLGIEREYQLRVESVHRNGQLATKFHVDLLGNEDHHHNHHTHHHGRHLPEIEDLILKANLPIRAEAWSLAVFRQLAVAEGAVHGIAPEKVHFHEVGAVDAIVDIVGTCLGLDWLGIDKIYCSALPTGGGTVKAAHGQMAVPVPAVLKLWEMRACPVYSNGIQKELVTPTGAAIATTLATDFGSPPTMTIQRIGQGAGSIDLPIPNILRLWLGVETLHDAPLQGSNTSPFLEAIAVLETQIDDLNPQAIGYALEALLAAGALDVFTQSIGMKKSRPGILLTVICYPDKVTDLEAIVFRETTTLGIRHYTQQRLALQREIQSVTTDYGTVRVKIAWTGTATERQITNVQPEYEDCWQIARRHGLPWREVHRLALQAWYEQNSE
ncbi:nickel pincer cofactor biosynthesis protein LarC [Chroococcidiopsis sp. CCALA 051]|uniref:nickel pincer cofactor biosynthesis protein LarC n=1 Tax=Chroococcidiopsis sp. CCALA 051 TaxID=869949 RepID=UPI000D0CCC92|nr:nickel pincer cofactor biosynthesis protein LarC [Chroococcidiopsis sp. CCALA 051]MBE9016066.1 nickel pincer cofactor biosynthesis protein LarC [Chroococcidiopsidales cyanobacterium LEGE 13417]PSM48923.1 nickel pincer cofactor biosynthesis protein LarC [Chroococcidiopsis sp. CCALA 051]